VTRRTASTRASASRLLRWRRDVPDWLGSVLGLLALAAALFAVLRARGAARARLQQAYAEGGRAAAAARADQRVNVHVGHVVGSQGVNSSDDGAGDDYDGRPILDGSGRGYLPAPLHLDGLPAVRGGNGNAGGRPAALGAGDRLDGSPSPVVLPASVRDQAWWGHE